MIINDTLLCKLEKLSALEITEKREELKQDLSEIVEFANELDKFDLNDQDFEFSNLATPLRDDEVINSSVINDVLNQAPQREQDFFIVPKIIE